MTHLYLSKDEQYLVTVLQIEEKIKKLKAIMAIAPFQKVNLFMYGTNGAFIGLDQSNFLINLGSELKLLIEENIELLEIEKNNLALTLK